MFEKLFNFDVFAKIVSVEKTPSGGSKVRARICNLLAEQRRVLNLFWIKILYKKKRQGRFFRRCTDIYHRIYCSIHSSKIHRISPKPPVAHMYGLGLADCSYRFLSKVQDFY